MNTGERARRAAPQLDAEPVNAERNMRAEARAAVLSVASCHRLRWFCCGVVSFSVGVLFGWWGLTKWEMWEVGGLGGGGVGWGGARGVGGRPADFFFFNFAIDDASTLWRGRHVRCHHHYFPSDCSLILR